MSSYLPHGTMRPQHALIALFLIAALSACTAGQDKNPDAKSAQKSNSASNDQKATVAKGETVTELDKAIFYILQARDNTYWFGSDGQGVYHYNGKTITRFTTNDGLVSNRIRGVQEDKAGNIYFTTYEGISRFDGQTFTTLIAPASSSVTEWKKQPDDLWFVGAPDTGAVYRYDGKSLHRLELPKTKIGEEQVARFPRSQFPNVKYLPYDVYTIVKDSKGNLWFGTAAAGICRFDGQSLSWMYEKHLTEVEGGGSFGIRSILEDKEGAFWICNTRYRFRIDPKDAPDPGKGLIKYKRETGTGQLKAPDGTDMVYFLSITEDNKGDLWMATYGSGVWRYDGKTTTHYPIKDGAKVITLFSIYKDNRGDLWLGTHEAGAYKFNGKTFEKFRP